MMLERRRLRLIPALVLFVLGSAASAQEGVEAGDEKDQKGWIQRIDREKPGIVMVGNSMQGEGIDFPALSKSVGVQVMDVRAGGSMSPWKYSVLKYVLAKTTYKPKMVIVEDRMNYVCCPQKRMRFGTYQKALAKIVADDTDRGLLDRLLAGEGQPKWERAWELAKAEPPYDGYFWDFRQSIKTSLLPEMIKLAKEGGYPLVFVRHKSRVYAEDPAWEPLEVRKYGEDLAAYLKASGVPFIDYTYCPELKADMYGNGDHLSRAKGRPVWTSMMAEDINALLAGKTPPRLHVPGKAAGDDYLRVPQPAPKTEAPATPPAKAGKGKKGAKKSGQAGTAATQPANAPTTAPTK